VTKRSSLVWAITCPAGKIGTTRSPSGRSAVVCQMPRLSSPSDTLSKPAGAKRPSASRASGRKLTHKGRKTARIGARFQVKPVHLSAIVCRSA
jgi:hypothetical protein